MKQRIIVAAVLLPLAFVVLVYLPPYVLAGAVSLVCALAAHELLHAIAGVKGNVRICVYTMVAAALIPVGVYFGLSSVVFPLVLLTLLSLVFIDSIARFKTGKPFPFAHILVTLFGGLLIPYLLSNIVNLRLMQGGRLLVLLPIISAFVTDAGAYFSGILLGRHKAFPHVSPKKTVEGCIGGIVIGTSSIVLYGIAIERLTSYSVSIPAMLAYGIIGAVLTELGDLAFSVVKREFDIKDYGQILPGHGGALDRFDSMIFTAPAIYLLAIAMPAF